MHDIHLYQVKRISQIVQYLTTTRPCVAALVADNQQRGSTSTHVPTMMQQSPSPTGMQTNSQQLELPCSRSIPLGNEDAPLFSPTQIPTQEQVLHSIFSPCVVPRKHNQTAGQSAKKPLPIKNDSLSKKWSSRQGLSCEVLASTIPPSITTVCGGGELTSVGRSPTITPKGVVSQYQPPSKSLHFSMAKNTSFESTASIDNNWFLLGTPTGRQQALFFGTPISEISELSDRTLKSTLRIPNIEMLGYDFLRQCTSKDILQKIITVLTTENKFPVLLRAAQQRWHDIGANHNNAGNRHFIATDPSRHLPILPPKSPVWSVGWNGRASEDNLHHQPNQQWLHKSRPAIDTTLVMSLSDSSCLAGEGLTEETESTLILEVSAKPSPAIEEDKSSTESKQQQGVATTMPLVVSSGDVEEAKATALAEGNLNICHGFEQNNFTNRPVGLTQAKEEVEQRIKYLEEAVLESTKKSHEMGNVIESLKKQNEQLQRRSKSDRDAREKVVQDANLLKTRFQRVLRELNDRLTLATEQERLLQAQKKEKTELKNMLKTLEQKISSLKRERDMMLTKLANAIGRKNLQIDSLDDSEMKLIVDQITKKISGGNEAAKALAEAYESAEEDRRKVEQAFKLSQDQLQKSISNQRRLQHENLLLTQSVQSMSDELSRNNEHVETLLQSARRQQRQDWEAQELHYKQIIQHLKEQIRSEESMVSTKLYLTKVDEVRKWEAECYAKQQQINMLTNNVERLERVLKTTRTPPTPPTTLPQAQTNSEAVAATVTVMNAPRSDKENSNPQSMGEQVDGSGLSQSSGPLKKPIRLTILQRAGGRKALLSQVKQMRSPKFASVV